MKLIIALLVCMVAMTWAQALPECDEDTCTFTQGYWKNHHSGKGTCPGGDCTWPICESTGETAENNEICALPWLTALTTPPKGSAWFILVHQWIAASLNLKDGRCDEATVVTIVAMLASAQTKLEICALDTSPGSELGMQMISIAAFLDAYNNGRIGPPHCFDDDNGGDDDDDGNGECPPQDCGERVCEIVEVCRFEKPPVCNGGNGDCCECSGRTFEEGCCTRTRGYWSNHNSENCPGNPQTTNCTADGWAWVDDSESKVLCEGVSCGADCGEITWLDVLDLTSEGCNGGGNAWNQLAAQWVAASLNVIHNEACVTVDVATALVQASALLEANCDPRCIDPNSPAGLVADGLKTILDEYNNGVRGPGHCEECECPDCPPLS